MVRKHRSLELSYGPRVNREVDQLTDTVQTGRYVFYDGTKVSYRAELRNETDVSVDVDSENFYFAEGDQ
jgi:hypothetical protein